MKKGCRLLHSLGRVYVLYICGEKVREGNLMYKCTNLHV